TYLPPTFRFVGIETHQAGSQQHHVARFEWQDPSQQSSSSLALIPGGTVTLGHDRTQRSVPREELVLEWMGYWGDEESDTPPAADYGAFYTYSDNKLLPLRTVTLQPFLIEMVAQEAHQVLPPPSMIYYRFKSEWLGEGYITRTYYKEH